MAHADCQRLEQIEPFDRLVSPAYIPLDILTNSIVDNFSGKSSSINSAPHPVRIVCGVPGIIIFQNNNLNSPEKQNKKKRKKNVFI